MKKSTQRWMNIIGLTVLGFNVAGVIVIFIMNAVHYRGDLLENGSLSLESVPAPGTSLSGIKTCVHPNELLVTGDLRRDDNAEMAGRGQVMITLLSPTRDILDRRGAWYTLPGCRKHNVAHFNVRFRTVPSGGSVMRIEWTAPGITRTKESSNETETASATSPSVEVSP